MKHLVFIILLSLCGGVGELFSPMSSPYPISRFGTKAAIAQEYCKNNKMNTDFCLLFDARIHSGKNRLVIWDFKKDSIVGIGLCSHGCCDGHRRQKDEKRMFIKQIVANNADLIPNYQNKTLTVRLHGLSAPRFNSAAQQLSILLNQTETLFPGSDLRLIFDNTLSSDCER